MSTGPFAAELDSHGGEEKQFAEHGQKPVTRDACDVRPPSPTIDDSKDAADCRCREKPIANKATTFTVDDDKDAFHIGGADEWEKPANADRKTPNKKRRTSVPKSKEDKGLSEQCSLTQLKKVLIRGEVQWSRFIKLAPLSQDYLCGRETHYALGAKPPASQDHPHDQRGSVYAMLASEADQQARQKPGPDMQAFLEEFSDVFQELPKGGTKERTIKYHIPTIPDKLPKYPSDCYNLSDEHLAGLKKKLKELLEKGFIFPSQAPEAAPVFVVPKRGGGLRRVTDYRPLKGITLKDDYPLPLIQDLDNRSGKARWFSKSDTRQGYYHVQVCRIRSVEDGFPCTLPNHPIYRHALWSCGRSVSISVMNAKHLPSRIRRACAGVLG